jgi:hypothetical protein
MVEMSDGKIPRVELVHIFHGFSGGVFLHLTGGFPGH